MTWIITWLTLANAVLLPVAVMAWLPRLLRTLACYKIWALRDELWDAIHNDTVEATPGALGVIDLAERSIKYLPMLSVTRMLPLQLAIRTTIPDLYHGIKQVAREEVRKVGVTESQPQVREARLRLTTILLRHTTVGWILGASGKLRRRSSADRRIDMDSRTDFEFMTILEAAAEVRLRSKDDLIKA
jgi:hypothetical protein